MTFREADKNLKAQGRETGYPSLDRTHLKDAKFSELHPLTLSMTPYHLIKLLNRKHLDRVCFESAYNGAKYTYRELLRDVERVAKSLRVYGVESGDTIVISTPALYESFVTFLAATSTGINVSLVHFYLDVETLADYIKAHEGFICFVYSQNQGYINRLRALSSQYGVEIVNIDYDDYRSGHIDTFDGFYKSYTMCHRKINIPYFDKDVRFYLQTSGSSSGKPKDMEFGLKQIFNMLMQASNASQTDMANDCSCILIQLTPLSMPYVMTMVFGNLVGGQDVNVIDGNNETHVRKFFSSIADRPDLVVFGIPPFYASLIELMPQDVRLPSKITLYNGGDHLSDELRCKLYQCFQAKASYGQKMHIQICDDYGIGEALCVGSDGKHLEQFDEYGKPRPRARAYRGTKWVLIDEEGHEVKYGEKGKILISSNSLCERYFGDEEATARAFFEQDGRRWFDTCDYGILYEDGCLEIIGREKNFFIPEGAPDKVNCNTLEHIISENGLVKHCCVVVSKKPNGTECGVAFVELEQPPFKRNKARKMLSQYAQAHLQSWQMPERFIILDSMPFMGSGKVDRTKLEAIANDNSD